MASKGALMADAYPKIVEPAEPAEPARPEPPGRSRRRPCRPAGGGAGVVGGSAFWFFFCLLQGRCACLAALRRDTGG